MLKLILDRRHKNNKIAYYLKSYLSLVWPATGLRNKLDRLLQSQRDKHAALQSRLDYYNKISDARTGNANLFLVMWWISRPSPLSLRAALLQETTAMRY